MAASDITDDCNHRAKFGLDSNNAFRAAPVNIAVDRQLTMRFNHNLTSNFSVDDPVTATDDVPDPKANQ